MHFKLVKVQLFTIAFVVSFIVVLGCAPRSYTRSHSELIAEAKARGEKVRTIEEDQIVFQGYEKHNRDKLYSLLNQREVGDPSLSDSDYVLGAGDVISLSVFGVDELNTKVRIAQSGMVSLPLVGVVKLGGLTEIEATKAIKSKLSQHLRSPQVVITIDEYGGHKVSVIGAVATPGNVVLRKDRNTLLEVIGSVGGITKEAGNFITLIPTEGSNKGGASLVEMAKSSLESYQTSNVDNAIEVPITVGLGLNNSSPIQIPLRGGDLVIVQPSGQVMVEGEVEKRGQYVLGENATLIGALAAAGGISYGARYDEVEIVRKLNNKEKVTLVYNLESIQSGAIDNPLLRNGDVVRVPSAGGKRFSQDVFKALQGFINFGVGSRLPI